MEINEIVEMLDAIQMAYPKFTQNLDEQRMLKMTDVWHAFFKDEDAGAVAAILEDYINTSPFPPSIADIKQKLKRLSLPTMEDLWTELVEAGRVSYGVEYVASDDGRGWKKVRNSELEYRKLSEPLKRYVGSGEGLEEFDQKRRKSALLAREIFDRRMEQILDECEVERMRERITPRKAIDTDGVKKIEEISARIAGKGN